MQNTNLLSYFITPLGQSQIQYMVTGSIASIIYGEPRLTHDVDLVVELEQDQVDNLLKVFPNEDYYTPAKKNILEEIRRMNNAHFNIIHMQSGFKADFYLVGNDPIQKWGMNNVRVFSIEGQSLRVACPEYVIIKKLQYCQKGNSEKHLHDIHGMLQGQESLKTSPDLLQKIDLLDLTRQWKKALSI